MNTDLARELGLEFPIFAFTHCRDVVTAVSKAGGLGVFGVAAHSAENLRAELDWIENELQGKPYGVDLLLPTKHAGSERGGFSQDELDERIPADHRAFLDDLLEKHEKQYGVLKMLKDEPPLEQALFLILRWRR